MLLYISLKREGDGNKGENKRNENENVSDRLDVKIKRNENGNKSDSLLLMILYLKRLYNLSKYKCIIHV